ncbi:family 61 putative glycoside hydrolase [Podospora australis]|uniref:lytic cellulose monooxygenase (C4-dehydrogenating) n=1 Tax=Podospora australis TaxID=1536484 RepID=A0AAN7AJF6_9PEZI|nr:family 61 putative glycoside hydrolase [Podospora australis]
MKVLATLLASVGLVAAHGYVDNATINGQFYDFYKPYMDPYMGNNAPQRISRSIPGNGPVENVNSIDVQCNAGSVAAPLHAPAAAGSTVTLRWTLWPDSHMGPVITYMARCPDSGCQNWSPGTSAVWFKIKQGGREGTSNNWAATPLMKAPTTYTYTIPSCLKPGYYLVRHEIIALHAAWAYPGAQFYPGCHQLQVTGGGNTTPSSLVAFPGAYKPTDPGVTYDAYKGEFSYFPSQTYTIPGPAVFSC